MRQGTAQEGRSPTGACDFVAAIRWEAQFKLAKCCMRASIAFSDLGVFLAEPVLAQSETLNDSGVPFPEDATT